MKRYLIIIALLAILVPGALLAQDELTLENLHDKLTALVELVTSVVLRVQDLSDRVDALEEKKLDQRLSAIETRTVPTPTLTPTPASTPTPTLTPTETPIPIPDTVLVVTVARGNARSGPGTQYDIVGVVTQGDTLTGPYQETEGWYQFCCVDDDETAWISKTLVSLKDKAELSAWETARGSAIEVDGETLLRYNDDYVGKLVYFSSAVVIQSLDEQVLVSLDNVTFEHIAWLIYENTSPRIITEDTIEFVALVIGLHTYQTSGRGALTVPLLEVIELRLSE